MAEQSTVFGLVTLGVILGSGVMLYGVKQTNGEHLNAVILVGGVIVLAAAGLLSLAVNNLDGPAHH